MNLLRAWHTSAENQFALESWWSKGQTVLGTLKKAKSVKMHIYNNVNNPKPKRIHEDPQIEIQDQVKKWRPNS